MDWLRALDANIVDGEDGVDAVLAVLERMADEGLPKNTDICHQISGPIWQRRKGRLRILFFCDGESHRIVCTHGFVKKSGATPRSEIKDALDIHKRYLEAKGANQLALGAING